jgi:phage shock protein A
MGLFDRFATLIKSNINDLISSAENPEKMLNQILIDMRDQLVKAKQQVAAAIADEKRLRDQADAEAKSAVEWEQRAMLAVREGRDDMAKQALVRQSEYLAHAQALEVTWQSHSLETEKLRAQLRDLNDKIEEAKRKKNILIARQKRAEAQKAIQDTMRGLSDNSAFDTFERMHQKVEQIEAESEASTELGGELTGDTLQAKFKKLEGSSGSDLALAELKAKMGLGPAPEQAALPEVKTDGGKP